ncbi:LacI family DNA-binding transcriptional regulator [Alloscardovia venturai]|uniref:LacI family DNA-binding transcriptional regulator n=1 Tax=Alloscardovia venturai TaxID=1769421 RepID=A0ABW2Y720_9BIFI
MVEKCQGSTARLCSHVPGNSAQTTKSTQAKIAEFAGVSVSTVSYAFSGRRKIAPKTRQKVLDAAAQLGYSLPSSAYENRARKHIIAVSAPIHSYSSLNGYSAFFFETLSGIRASGSDLLLFASEADELERIARNDLADGVILLDVKRNDPRAFTAEHLSLPVVSIGVPVNVECKKVFSTDLDFKRAAEITIQHAAESGLMNILVLGDREQAYKDGSNYLFRFKKYLGRYALEFGIAVNFAYSPKKIMDIAEVLEAELTKFPETDALVINSAAEVVPIAFNYLSHRKGMKPLPMLSVGSYGNLPNQGCMIDEIPFEPHRAVSLAMRAISRQMNGDISMCGKSEMIEPRYLDRGTFKK